MKEELETIKLTAANSAPGFNCEITVPQWRAMEKLNEGLREKLPKRIAGKISYKEGYLSEWRNAEPLTAKQTQTLKEIMRQHYQEKLGCEVRIVMKCYGCCEGGYNLYYPEEK